MPCVKQLASGGPLQSPGAQLGAGTTQHGRWGRGQDGGPEGGVFVYRRLIYFIAQQKLTHCKATIIQFKKIYF